MICGEYLGRIRKGTLPVPFFARRFVNFNEVFKNYFVCSKYQGTYSRYFSSTSSSFRLIIWLVESLPIVTP